MMENIRMYKNVKVIERKMKEEVKMVKMECKVKKGEKIIVYKIRKNSLEEYWDKNDVLNNEKKMKEKKDERKFYYLIKLSEGKRRCVGRKYELMKIKILL
jgi:cytochrome P450